MVPRREGEKDLCVSVAKDVGKDGQRHPSMCASFLGTTLHFKDFGLGPLARQLKKF